VVYPENFEQKIDFHKIRQSIDSFCLSPLGQEKIGEMQFSTSFEEIDRRLSQTDEFIRILQEEDSFPTDHFYDVRPVLRRLHVEGSWIDQNALLELRRSLQTIYGIVAFLRRDEDGNPKYPHLLALAGNVVVYPDLIKKIDTILDDSGQVKDSASPQLADIRRRLTTTMNSVSKILNTILRNAQSEGFVDRDVTPAMRDGRLVIPVDPSHKRRIRGIVHDESASGKTVYIEPAEVVEANNRIRELENEERREIIRILTNFTDYLRPFLPDLLEAYEFLGWIDFIRAKAKFSRQIHAIKPVVENRPEIDWVQAVHPLLYLSLQKVNIDIKSKVKRAIRFIIFHIFICPLNRNRPAAIRLFHVRHHPPLDRCFPTSRRDRWRSAKIFPHRTNCF
jgi:DNA mismatch repair protein MutS2